MQITRGKKHSPTNEVGLWFILLLSILLTDYIVAQDTLDISQKSIRIDYMQNIPEIDGTPDPYLWTTLPLASGFIQYEPFNKQRPSYETEIRFGYDESGLYVVAFMHDPHPDSILTERGMRDQVDELNTDYLSVDILPYNDGLTMFEFKITPTGLQSDNKYSGIRWGFFLL